jgi:hypothetical protein
MLFKKNSPKTIMFSTFKGYNSIVGRGRTGGRSNKKKRGKSKNNNKYKERRKDQNKNKSKEGGDKDCLSKIKSIPKSTTSSYSNNQTASHQLSQWCSKKSNPITRTPF